MNTTLFPMLSGAPQAALAAKSVSVHATSGAPEQQSLVKKVRDVGSGTWADMPLPLHTGEVCNAEIRPLVTWVLTR